MKSYLLYNKWRTIYQVYPDPLIWQIVEILISLHRLMSIFILKKDFRYQWVAAQLFMRFIIYMYQKHVRITKTRLFKYIENFISKNWKFSDEKLIYFSYFCSKT